MDVTQFFIVFLLSLASLVNGTSAPKLQPFTFPKTLHEGQTVKAICTPTEGERPLEFQWLKDGHPLMKRSLVDIKTFDDYSLLKVSSIGEKDIGNYTCIVRNHHGSDQFTTSLSIPVAPKWIREPTSVSVSLGNSVTLDCIVGGYPKPIVSWTFHPTTGTEEAKSVTFKEHFQIATNGSLVITSVQEKDTGKYKCSGSNGIGSDVTKMITLSLYGKISCTYWNMIDCGQTGRELGRVLFRAQTSHQSRTNLSMATSSYLEKSLICKMEKVANVLSARPLTVGTHLVANSINILVLECI